MFNLQSHSYIHKETEQKREKKRKERWVVLALDDELSYWNLNVAKTISEFRGKTL